MIVVDTSAIVAMYHDEPEASAIRDRVIAAAALFVSAATLLETAIVLSNNRFGVPKMSDSWLDEFLEQESVLIEPVTVEQAQLARAAFTRYGKGTGHPAQLNFGDCFSYALAKALDVPLLFKGDDFAQTDVVSALAYRAT